MPGTGLLAMVILPRESQYRIVWMAVCLEPVDAVDLLVEFCLGRARFVDPGGFRQVGDLLDHPEEVVGQVVEAQEGPEVTDQVAD